MGQRRHYETFRKHENFVCFKGLRNRKCFHNAASDWQAKVLRLNGRSRA